MTPDLKMHQAVLVADGRGVKVQARSDDFDVPEGEVETARKLIETAMCGAMTLPNGVPIEAGTGVGKNWLEAH